MGQLPSYLLHPTTQPKEGIPYEFFGEWLECLRGELSISHEILARRLNAKEAQVLNYLNQIQLPQPRFLKKLVKGYGIDRTALEALVDFTRSAIFKPPAPDDDFYKTTLGGQINKEMRRIGATTETFAKQIGCTEVTLKSYLRNISAPKEDYLHSIADALGVNTCGLSTLRGLNARILWYRHRTRVTTRQKAVVEKDPDESGSKSKASNCDLLFEDISPNFSLDGYNFKQLCRLRIEQYHKEPEALRALEEVYQAALNNKDRRIILMLSIRVQLFSLEAYLRDLNLKGENYSLARDTVSEYQKVLSNQVMYLESSLELFSMSKLFRLTHEIKGASVFFQKRFNEKAALANKVIHFTESLINPDQPITGQVLTAIYKNLF